MTTTDPRSYWIAAEPVGDDEPHVLLDDSQWPLDSVLVAPGNRQDGRAFGMRIWVERDGNWSVELQEDGYTVERHTFAMPADKPRLRDPEWSDDIYVERVAELEAEGATTSDAQSVALAEYLDRGEHAEASE